MAFVRQVLFPLLILLVFVIALVAVSARIFLPSDMLAPAPVSDAECFGHCAEHNRAVVSFVQTVMPDA